MRLPKVLPERRVAQWTMAIVVVAIGVQFTLWARAHLAGAWPGVSRPAGVEGFLPIDAMLAVRHLLATGTIDAIHPAALAIFVGICLMSALVARSFCSHLCPFGLASELLGRLGLKHGVSLRVPRWLDIPLRGLRFVLLAFFVWAVWLAMDADGVATFLGSPYAKVADVKMWQFFASPSRLTLSVLGIVVVGSIFVRDLWCRYLCPYGALLGMFGRLAPLKITRNADACIDCGKCTKVCPARLTVHTKTRVSSMECTACQTCVVACPVKECLSIRPPVASPRLRWWYRPVVATAIAVGLYLVVIGGFRLAGYWHSSITEAEYHFRLGEIDSPLYTHVGGRAMTDDRVAASSQSDGGRAAR